MHTLSLLSLLSDTDAQPMPMRPNGKGKLPHVHVQVLITNLSHQVPTTMLVLMAVSAPPIMAICLPNGRVYCSLHSFS